MIIELVGLSGSGKSTFARALCTDGRYVRVKISGTRELIWLNLLFLLRYPIVGARLFFLLFRFRGPASLWKHKFVTIFLDYNAKYMKARRTAYAILDQGHTQTFFSLFEHPLERKLLDKIFAYLPKPDHYVVFNISENLRQKRLAARGYDVRPMMDESEKHIWQEAALTQSAPLFENIVRGGVPSWMCGDDGSEAVLEYFLRTKSLYYIVSGRMPTEKAYGGQVVEMCQAFAQHGVRTEIWCPQRRNPVTDTVYEYYRAAHSFAFRTVPCMEWYWHRGLYARIAFYLDQVFFLLALYRNPPPKDAIVYARRPEVAWLCASRGNIVIFESHEWLPWMAWLQLWFIKDVKRVVTTNSFIKKKFVAGGVSPEKVVVVPNGVAFDIFAVDTSRDVARSALSTEHPLPPAGVSVLLYTGSYKTMGEDKGIADILKALPYTDATVHFVAVGGSPEDISEYQALAEKVGVADKAHLLGRVGKSDLALFQRYADALLMPFPRKAHYEYFMSPLKTFEYMASGRPIVASRLPSILEILSETTSFFCEPDNPEDLARVIGEVLADTLAAEARAFAARTEVHKYTWTERAQAVLRGV